MGQDARKYGCAYAHYQVVDAEGPRGIVEFKAEYLHEVAVDKGVLEAPEEAHYVGGEVEWLIDAEDCDEAGQEHDQDVCQTRDFGPEVVN